MFFMLGVFGTGFLLIQLEFFIILLPLGVGVAMAPESDILWNALSFILTPFFFVTHFKATWLICNNIQKSLADIKMAPEKNKIWIGALWRIVVEWDSMKKILFFSKK